MDTITKKISTTLKYLRNNRGWSLDTTSKNTGVSKAMLGQIERGESSPTIATLWKIASGFNTSFSSFIEDISPDNTHIIHSKQSLKQLHQEDNKIKIMPLFAYNKELNCEIFIIELQPGCEHLSPPHQNGVIEHVIVANGKIEVLVNNKWINLTQNEGLRFPADKPHGYRNMSTTPATFHDIIHYK